MLIATALTINVSFSFAQKKNEPAKAAEGWHHLELKLNKVYGINTEGAYKLLGGNKGSKVIVAVIDGGTDINHEDLKEIIWTNPGETPNNGVDDDKNGYVDDLHGWNFIGGKEENIHHDTYELTRLYVKMKPKYNNPDTVKFTKEDWVEYEKFLDVRDDYETQFGRAKSTYDLYTEVDRGVNSLLKKLRTTEPVLEDVLDFTPLNKGEIGAKGYLVTCIKQGMTTKDARAELTSVKEYYGKQLEYYLNTGYNQRQQIVGDFYESANQRNYGNADVIGPDAGHGTHVAGIIAAIRNNGKGMNGIADNVSIMVVRVVPDGDERDKDVANAIRYAADNGASVINMSFGKYYVYNKKAVDDAIKYAMSKDVLMVHAAGNDYSNIDYRTHYPTSTLDDSTKVTGWMEVGALNWTTDKTLMAAFSNFGHASVDVFAPGVDIFSTVPNNEYKSESGTSMAAPVTAGVGALIRSRYPTLTAEQVKQVIIKSVVPIKKKVLIPSTRKKKEKVKFKKMSISGGAVNMYNAIVLASQTVGAKK